MKIRFFYIILSICCLGFLPGSYAQSIEKLPKLHPSYINQFYQENASFSNKCFSDVFLDHRGRLWLNVCGQARVINSIGLFQFDGYGFQHVELFSPEGILLKMPKILGVDEFGRLFGTAENRQFFFMDPDTRQIRIVPVADATFSGLSIGNVIKAEGSIHVLGYMEASSIHLFVVKNDTLVKEQSFDYSDGYWGSANYPQVIDSQETWLMGASLPLYRFDRKSKTARAYYPPDFIGPSFVNSLTVNVTSGRSPTLLKSPDENVYLFLPDYYGNLLFQFDRKKDQFMAMDKQFPSGFTPVNIFPDQVGNICFLFQDSNKNYRAVLMDAEGCRFDYSAVVAEQRNIVRLAGRDFRRQVFMMGNNGLSSAGIRQEGAIRQALVGNWISAMAPLPDGRLLVNTVKEGWFVYDETTESASPFQGSDCGLETSPFAEGMKQQIISDDEGNFWFISYNYLLRYDPLTNTCSAYDLGKRATLFGFMSKELAVIQDGQESIMFFDLKTKKTVSFSDDVPKNLDGFIRDIFIDSKGILWVPTNKGLWRIDLEHQQSKVLGLEDGFTDFRFTSIYEDAKGRIWLGTYFGGLHIYDPKNGAITIVDQRQGLSHNAVMSIIPDDDGEIWVSTEYGINIVSKEGEVLNIVYEKDGLTHDIFERFDPLKLSDGRLLFGSRQGISIIDPGKLKAAFKNEEEVKIYLNELVYFDKKAGKEVLWISNFQELETIQISAERPNIRLKFSLSSYLEPQKNCYAYQLEGIDKDWHYLGAQPELNISRLPPGKYRLLLKGADFRNNWTKEPIAIDIHAREFFYKKAWFYLLVSLPFLTFGLIWARNKQLEARRLEMEVARRTQKIREDKALIEEQTKELQQMDTLKSQFFTNISHELRTPVTLIAAPLENLIQKYGSSLDERIGRSLKLVLKNAGKLGKLVEELLELSRLEAKKATLKEVSTPVSLFCRHLFSAYHSGAVLKNIDFTFYSELKEETCFLIDRNRLGKILNNLIANALKFTPANGIVEVKVERVGGDLLIEVKDSGRGIPTEDLPYIFDRYFQTKREDIATEGGTGIGLALSKELAQLMEGDLSVESEWGQGACFRLRFPAKEAPLEESEPTITIPDQPISRGEENNKVLANFDTVGGQETSRTKILIVEDNKDMQELLLTLLADTHDCLIAHNGAEAWAWLESENPVVEDVELILSDVMMPEMDGYTLLGKIKDHVRWQKVPVIMLTARAAEEDKLLALRLGVDDYLLKPFSPDELKARVKNLIANYQARKQIHAEVHQLDRGVNVEFESAESADFTWLKEVEEAAKEALDKELKLTAAYLSAQIFISERQFSRKLKAITGLTPNGYIQEVKLQKARHLLENKIYTTTTEVARVSGYSSASYLAKIYQERFGKTPGDYL